MENKPIPLPRTSLQKKKESQQKCNAPPIPERPKNIFNNPPPIPPRTRHPFFNELNNHGISFQSSPSSSIETFPEDENDSVKQSNSTEGVLFQNPEYVSIDAYKCITGMNDCSLSDSSCTESLKQESNDNSVFFDELKQEENSLEPVFIQSSDEGSPEEKKRISIRTDPIMGFPDKYDGEKITFYGWVECKSGRKVKKYWGALKDGYLHFYDNEDCENNSILSYNLADLVYVGRSFQIPNCIIILLRSKDKTAIWTRVEMTTDADQFKTWTHLLARSVVPSSKYYEDEFNDLEVGGLVWFKEGTTSQWSQGWLYICKRKLHYMKLNMIYHRQIDIRKIRCLKKNICKTDWCPFIYNSNEGPLVCSQGGSSFYMQGENDTCTDLWYENISNELLKIDNTLEGQRLTADDIPYIVDKCIKFISTYGKTIKGLYRKNGSAIETRVIAEGLKKDPANYQILREREETVFAVADALRSFFRQLNQPVVSTYIHQELYDISDIGEKDSQILEKYNKYAECLRKLEQVNYNTLKALICHLREITDHSDKNFASIENISKIFAPTLFSVDNRDEDISLASFTKTGVQMLILRDLLINYKTIFSISKESDATSMKIDKAIEEINKPAKSVTIGLLVPIHLYEKDNQCFNVQAELKAAEVCSYASGKAHVQESSEKHDLFEVIKGGALKRKIRSEETLTPIVANRWMDWDHRDCYLLYGKDPYPLSLTNHKPYVDDVKIAEPGSKSYKTCHLKIEPMNSDVYVIQLSKSSKPINSFNMKDILWFDGYENDRKPPYEHNVTLIIPSPKLKYKSKFIGYCISFREHMQKIQWLNEMHIASVEYNPCPILHY
uniref:Rho-GAP domain-containing protein n=1 Tax=Parastrongyloides trichosuri TaxID=131310 RepID=A0A0N4ZG36_PARTI